MIRPRNFLSRTPHFEPPLDRRRRPVDAPDDHPRAPSLHTRRRTPHDGRSAHSRDSGDTDRMTTQRFAEHAMRLALEVLDRRRAPDRLRAVLAASVIDALRSRAASEIPARRLGAAVLGAVRMQPVDEGAIEVFATYTRGPRVFAMAGRITVDQPGDSWRMTSLQI